MLIRLCISFQQGVLKHLESLTGLNDEYLSLNTLNSLKSDLEGFLSAFSLSVQMSLIWTAAVLLWCDENWDCKHGEESGWCGHLHFVVSLWEGFVYSWNHDSFHIILSLSFSQALLCHASLSPSHCHCHFFLSISLLLLFSLVTLDRAAYGQLKTKEQK